MLDTVYLRGESVLGPANTTPAVLPQQDQPDAPQRPARPQPNDDITILPQPTEPQTEPEHELEPELEGRNADGRRKKMRRVTSHN